MCPESTSQPCGSGRTQPRGKGEEGSEEWEWGDDSQAWGLKHLPGREAGQGRAAREGAGVSGYPVLTQPRLAPAGCLSREPAASSRTLKSLGSHPVPEFPWRASVHG